MLEEIRRASEKLARSAKCGVCVVAPTRSTPSLHGIVGTVEYDGISIIVKLMETGLGAFSLAVWLRDGGANAGDGYGEWGFGTSCLA